MINLYDSHRFISKSTLAKLAEVSPRTFARYLKTRRHILDTLGVSPGAQKLPPQAVLYICEDYCIDLPPELQDQHALSQSPLYQQFLHHLQTARFRKIQDAAAIKEPKPCPGLPKRKKIVGFCDFLC